MKFLKFLILFHNNMVYSILYYHFINILSTYPFRIFRRLDTLQILCLSYYILLFIYAPSYFTIYLRSVIFYYLFTLRPMGGSTMERLFLSVSIIDNTLSGMIL